MFSTVSLVFPVFNLVKLYRKSVNVLVSYLLVGRYYSYDPSGDTYCIFLRQSNASRNPNPNPDYRIVTAPKTCTVYWSAVGRGKN